jgi:hypothetical protein
MASLNPGVELAYQVPFAHALSLEAAGKTAEADSHFEMAHAYLASLLKDLEEEDRAGALLAVAAHREVVEAWMRRRPQRIERRLAGREAPTGRPLAPHEWVSVHWTIRIPADDAIADPVARRRERLQRLLAEADAQGGAPTVDDLAAALEASVATIRRDLAALRRSGRPALTRGTRRRPGG